MEQEFNQSFERLARQLSGADKRPLYRQVQEILRKAFSEKVIGPSNALPPERQLAELFGVSRVTLRKALDGLAEERLINRRRGSGTTVAARVQKQFTRLTSFTEDMRSRGGVASSRWLAKESRQASVRECFDLGMVPGSFVSSFERLRFCDGVPMAIELSIIPQFALGSIELVDHSLYEALDKTGYRPVRALQKLRAIAFSARQAGLLELELGAPGLAIERRGFLADGRAVEFTMSYYRGDRYDFLAELEA